MTAITICSDFGAQKIKSDTVSTVSPSISHPHEITPLSFSFLPPESGPNLSSSIRTPAPCQPQRRRVGGHAPLLIQSCAPQVLG